MAVTNNLLIYAANTTNKMDDATYEAASQRISGVLADQVISSSLNNTVMRSSTLILKVLVDALIESTNASDHTISTNSTEEEVKALFKDFFTHFKAFDGKKPAYYLDYNNFTNTPTIGDGTITVVGRTGTIATFNLNDTEDTTIDVSNQSAYTTNILSQAIPQGGTSEYLLYPTADVYDLLIVNVAWRDGSTFRIEPITIPVKSIVANQEYGFWRQGWAGGYDWVFYFKFIFSNGHITKIKPTSNSNCKVDEIYGVLL